MKKFLFAITISLALAACGDDSSSNANDRSDKATEDYVFTRTATLYANESEHTLIMALENFKTVMCIAEETDFNWKTVYITNERDSMMYEFRNDTLVLYDIEEGKPELEYGDVMVGGTAGNVYGRWTYTGCRYNKNNDTTSCNEKNLWHSERALTFSKGKVEIYYKVYYDRYLEENSDYMNSYFMASLIHTLSGNHPEAYLSDIWYMDPSSVQTMAEEDGAVFTSKTKTSAIFVLGGKTYSVNVTHAEMNLTREGLNLASENRDFQVEVSDGITTCKGEYFTHYMNADYCKMEYKDNFRMHERTNSNGEMFLAAEKYSRINEEEFTQCVAGIAYKKYNPHGEYSSPEVAKNLKKYRKKQSHSWNIL